MLPLVVASAPIRRAAPRARVKQATLRARLLDRMRVPSSISKTISPEIACDNSITAERSRYSTGVPMVSAGPGGRSSCRSCGDSRSSCRTLPSAPQRQIAVAGVPQIGLGGRLETARRVEVSGQFVGDPLVVNETAGTG